MPRNVLRWHRSSCECPASPAQVVHRFRRSKEDAASPPTASSCSPLHKTTRFRSQTRAFPSCPRIPQEKRSGASVSTSPFRCEIQTHLQGSVARGRGHTWWKQSVGGARCAPNQRSAFFMSSDTTHTEEVRLSRKSRSNKLRLSVWKTFCRGGK